MVLIDVESENGWRPADLRPDDPLLVWKTIPGTSPPVTIQVMAGLPEVFLPAWVADWNQYIESVEDNTTASYTDGNSVYTSNHKNGTAVDTDWEKHPYEARTFTPEQTQTIHEMVEFYEGWMFWAGDWISPIDQMHSQMGYNTWNRNTAALDFFSRKIRSDGFSTFRRGPLSAIDPPNAGAQPSAPMPDTPASPAQDGQDSTDSPTQVLYDAVPEFDMDDATRMLPLMQQGLILTQAKTTKAIASWFANMGTESGGFVYTEEIAKNGPYAPYIGRTYVQITWDYNYRAFGQWCVQQGLLTDSESFIKDPASLADIKWASLGPAWYCTVEEPAYLQYAEDGDIENSAKAINAPAWIGDSTKHANGIDDRWARYNQAIALGDRLLLLVKDTTEQGDGPLDALTPEEQHQLLNDVVEIRNQLEGNWAQNSNDPDAAKQIDTRKAAGERLSVNDLLVWLKNHVSTHKAPTP